MQCSVRWVFEPTFNENAVIRLKRKVLCYIVHNDCFMKWAANTGQVLDENHASRTRVLPIKSIGDVLVLVD